MSVNVRQCRQCLVGVGHGRKCGGSRWNRFATCFRSNVISTSGLIDAILHSGCRSMSDNVRSALSKSGVVRNMVETVEISFVVVTHEQVSCIYANFKVFPVFRPPYWISGMCQIWFEGIIL